MSIFKNSYLTLFVAVTHKPGSHKIHNNIVERYLKFFDVRLMSLCSYCRYVVLSTPKI